MSAPSRIRVRRRSDRPPLRFYVVSAVLLDALILVGAAAWWPVYRGAQYVLLVAVALLVAHAIALIGARRRWSGWWMALGTFGGYVVLGIPLAMPSALTGLDAAARGLLDVAVAPVTGWKDLLTLELPLGSYQATLAPALLVFLAVPVATLSLAWRAQRLWVLAPALALVPVVLGVLFGSSELSDPLQLGWLTVFGPVEMAIGVAAVLLALGYALWRTLYERRRALRVAEAASGVRTTGSTAAAITARLAIGMLMVVIAVGVAGIAAPVALAGQPRDVLRSRIDPALELAAQVSPLSQYRAFFSDDLYDEVLFTVEGAGAVHRVRLATLPFYDGQVARVVDPATGSGDQTTAFSRVPASLPADDGTLPAAAGIEIIRSPGVWTPTIGALTSIAFDDAGAHGRSGGFFYNAATQAGVTLPDGELDAGTTYRVEAAVPVELPALETLVPGRESPRVAAEVVPESLTDWIRAQQAPKDGAGLALLIDRLRARGYLSHGLQLGQEPPAWVGDLGDYAFEPSRAGHSTDRIDGMFTDLLQKQDDAGADAPDSTLVAAVGDDEQFAVAAALVADQLGFASRIVMGARLQTGAGPGALSACSSSGCRGADMAVWVEVQDASGVWVPVDVTPQHLDRLDSDVEQRRDPLIPTDVRPDQAESVPPAEADPADDGDRDDQEQALPADLSGLWAVLRVTGIAAGILLLLSAPFLLVLLAKSLRRRARRDAPEVVARFTGGWDEYVDAAVDHGRPAPRAHTRSELVALYAIAGGEGARLASWSDRSVFDRTPPSEEEATRFWEIVDAERARFSADLGWWGRLRARLSPRSLVPPAVSPARRASGSESASQARAEPR